MNQKLDKKTQERLLEALASAKAYGEKLRRDRENQLWKEVKIPCSLNDAINRLTKDEMVKVRQQYDFKNLSALKKAELAVELVRRIPAKFKQVIFTLDQSRYDMVKLIVRNSGAIPDPGITLTQAEVLIKYSLIFPGMHEDKKVLFMPAELIGVFELLDGPELENTVRRNTEWILLAQGLLYFYGVMDAWHVRERIETLTGQTVDMLELMRVMSFACDFYEQVRPSTYGYQDSRVFDAREIVEEHGKRPSVDYYHFTTKQLLRAGEPDCVHKTPALNSFLSFLLKHYELSVEDTNEIALQMTNMIMAGSGLDIMLGYLQNMLEIPDLEFLQELTHEVETLNNNTRQWALKGHTPAELFQEKKKHSWPLQSVPVELKQAAKVVELPAQRTKVGRNDPCPCGSGKKFKKCCGS